MTRTLLKTLFVLPSILLGQIPNEITLNDGTGTKTWIVSSLPASSTLRQAAPTDLVLYPKNAPKTSATRRLLTRRIHLEMDGTLTAATIAKSAKATSFKVPHYSQKDLILTFPNPGDSLAQLPLVSTLPGVKSARPLLSQKRSPRLTPNDPRFAYRNSNTSYQWHLKNTGQNGSIAGLDVNVTSVWDTYLGTGVTVSVVDDGVQVAHEDLASNINSSIDHDWNDNTPNDPTPPLDLQADGTYYSHGTSVAGVIASRGDNNLGTTGAAPRANIVGLKILAAEVSPAEEAEALAWRTDIIDICNNSWGTPDDGFTLYKTDPLIVSALADSVANGRGGKGTIYVWSAGNGRIDKDYANYDGFVNQPETIGVGSINFQGNQSVYSESGANLLISAPSDNDEGEPGITTTTLTTEGTYTDFFGGTSSAAPLVSGVIALILEANPNLGWRDVQEVLIRSARKVDSSNPGWSDNSAGFHFHHGYGAGMIDAAAAVTLAKTWTNLGPRTSRQAAGPTINRAIPDDSSAGITHTFTVTGNELRVEHVTLTIDIEHPYRGDLAITLTSPDGTISRLAEEHDDDSADYENFPLLSVRQWGESALGSWTLQVSDEFEGDTGILKSASLQIHGAEPDLPTEDYSAWVTEKFPVGSQGNPTIVGELADPDQDGRSNLLEYAFNGNPISPDPKLSREPKFVQVGPLNKLRFTRDNAKEDITYILQSSTTLSGTWQTVPTDSVSSNGSLEVREYPHNVAPQRFFRIEISK
ncbi:MAG: subtilisin family serine protease [Akkermansiaceae bacterium]|jgi:subtilisin family serine protease